MTSFDDRVLEQSSNCSWNIGNSFSDQLLTTFSFVSSRFVVAEFRVINISL